jgi:phosphatidylglycerophosphate synthase
MFVRPLNAWDREPGAYEALTRLFTPLWPALLALFLSHGVSFWLNFLAQREHQGATISSLMVAPYRRVVLMQFTLIFGGWLVMALNNPMPALVLLIVLKVAADLRAHRRERGMGAKSRE